MQSLRNHQHFMAFTHQAGTALAHQISLFYFRFGATREARMARTTGPSETGGARGGQALHGANQIKGVHLGTSARTFFADHSRSHQNYTHTIRHSGWGCDITIRLIQPRAARKDLQAKRWQGNATPDQLLLGLPVVQGRNKRWHCVASSASWSICDVHTAAISGDPIGA